MVNFVSWSGYTVVLMGVSPSFVSQFPPPNMWGYSLINDVGLMMIGGSTAQLIGDSHSPMNRESPGSGQNVILSKLHGALPWLKCQLRNFHSVMVNYVGSLYRDYRSLLRLFDIISSVSLLMFFSFAEWSWLRTSSDVTAMFSLPQNLLNRESVQFYV